MIVVIPTNRSVQLDYLKPLIEADARFIIVDDSEGSITIDHPQFEVYNWSDRRRILGELDVGMPKRNGACRDFGFYIAWCESDDDEIIVALDDDCRVDDADFAKRVQATLSDLPRPTASVEGRHLNVIDLYENVPDHLFPRGFPYSKRLDYVPSKIEGESPHEIKFNLGLWRGGFDINAIDKIQGPAWDHPEANLKHASVVIGPGKWISVCSMNMHFRREIVPATYQLPMHVEVMPGWPVDRYGDIWGGFVLKALMDLRGDAMSAGAPMIYHAKHPNYQRNIWQEHLCHLTNDEFIELLAAVAEDITPGPHLDMMAALNEGFRHRLAKSTPLLRAYLTHLVDALAAWIQALKKG